MENRILVIGGGLAGLSAASAALETDSGTRVRVFARSGAVPCGSSELPYFISGSIFGADGAVPGGSGQKEGTDELEVLEGYEVIGIKPDERQIIVRDLSSGHEEFYGYDSLIMAMGVTMQAPAIDGMDLKNVYLLKSIGDVMNIRNTVESGAYRRAVVCGGGPEGLAAAERLWNANITVALTEENQHILASFDQEIAALVKRMLEDKGIEVFDNEAVIALIGNARGEVVEAHTPERILQTDLVIWARGFGPDVTLAREAGIAIGETGAIRLNEYLETSIPGIYAAGDCAEVFNIIAKRPAWCPTGPYAARLGRAAGINASASEQRKPFHGVLGTRRLRLFNQDITKVGLSSSEAKEAGLQPESVLLAFSDPGSNPAAYHNNILMLISDRDSHRVIGAQSIGGAWAGCAADALASAMNCGITVEELCEADLAYSPFYPETLHPAVMSARIMLDKLEGRLNGISPASLKGLLENNDAVIVDLRSAAEVMLGTIPNAKHIPFEELNARMNELGRDKLIIFACRDGRKSCKAYGILRRSGYVNISILDGGFSAYPYKLA